MLVAAAVVVILIAWDLAEQHILGGVRDDRQRHSITYDQYQAAAIGTPRAELDHELGQPEEIFAPPAGSAEAGGLTCETYREKGAQFLLERAFRLCFGVDGRLATKRST